MRLRAAAAMLAVLATTAAGFRPCTCRGREKALLTSPGGVGSSHAFRFLRDVNHPEDGDGCKHRHAKVWAPLRCTRNGTIAFQTKGVCYDEVVVMYGNPLHAIESVTRRYRYIHIWKLRREAFPGAPRFSCTPHFSRDPAKSCETHDLLQRSIRSGRDESGMTSYLESWLDAFEHRSQWPKMLLASTRDLYASRCVDDFVGEEHLAAGRRSRALPGFVEHAAAGNYSAAELRALDRVNAVVEKMAKIGGCASYYS